MLIIKQKNSTDIHFQIFHKVQTMERSKDKWNTSSDVNYRGSIGISEETYFKLNKFKRNHMHNYMLTF